MKKLLLMSVILCSCFLTNAQPVLDSVWFSKSKNFMQTLYLGIKDDNHYSYEEIKGEQVVWDFSNLKAVKFDSESYFTEIDFTNPKRYSPNSNWINILDSGAEILLHHSDNQLNVVGYRLQGNCDIYTDALTWFIFPMTYHSAFKDTASCSFNKGQTLRITYREAVVDGYGTLVLPQDIFKNVIRIKLKDKVLDYDSKDNEVIAEMSQITYYYLSTAFYIELLTINILSAKEKNINRYEKTILFNPALKSHDIEGRDTLSKG